MKFRLERLGPNFKAQLQPVCACCGYDADWIVGIYDGDEELETKRIERTFCERDMRDALLDAINFNTLVPDSFIV